MREAVENVLQTMISYDKDRAEWMVDRLLDAYIGKKYIFKRDITVPEVKLSEDMELGKKHALTLFYTIALDSMRQSEYVYKAGKKLASEYSVEDLANLKISHIKAIMGKIMDNGIGDPAVIIFQGSRMLKNYFNGDPREIFYQDIDNARLTLNDFYGISEGKSALIMKNFQRFGYTNYNHNEIPIKIDRHAIRLSIGNGVIKVDVKEPTEIAHHKFVKYNGNRLEDVFKEITIEKDLDAVLLDDAKFIVGSMVCKKKSYSACKELCPLDCNMLVKTNRTNRMFLVPSDIRPPVDKNLVYQQMELF